MAMNVARAIDELRSLSVDERLQVIHAIWDSLSETVTIPMSPQQEAELNRRLDAYEADPSDLLTWDQVLDRLRGRL